ncbi:MAG: hypothetical protein DI529_12650 [Chryseobacterium sp.]|nr:MAG: hypothetical protein DI529_12650 [Chryseobacterium sp.]
MKTKNYFKKIAIAAIGLFASNIQANNLKITGTSVDTSAGTVTFNIQWENSWRTNIAPANHDAVWVFIKYQDCADKLWKHANLSVTASDHSTASPLKIDAVTDGKGVFVYRSSNGGGNVSSTSVTLKMNVAAANYENYNFKVFGVEMVNIPTGSFTVGDGTSTSSYTQYTVTGNGSIATSSLGSGDSAPSAFPKGYNAFYSMKYEITQEQYVEFLNTLNYNQQARRTAIAPNSIAGTSALANATRNGIKIQVPGNNASVPAVYACDLTQGDYNDVNDGQNIAANYLTWADLAAYLDWSALRPMTEMEFEKICRGPLAPVAGEYTWGSTAIQNILWNGVANSNLANEGSNTVVADGKANYFVNGNSYQNPLKIGFTATNSSGRAAATAAYYGAMEMGGNVMEMTVTTKSAGNTFTGVLGDGELSNITATEGDADQLLWPDNTSAAGIIIRGGSFMHLSTALRISDRSQGSPAANRYSYGGGRGVR